MDTELKDRIELLRKNKSWTQGQLALYAEIDRSYVTKLESGDAPNVSGIILARIARVLGTSTDYLLNLTDDPRPFPSVNHPALRDPRVHQLLDLLAALDDPEIIGHVLAFVSYFIEKRTAGED